MKTKKNYNNLIFNSIIVLIAVLVTTSLIVGSTYINRGYDINVGEVSTRKILADKDFVNEYATNKLIDAAKGEVSLLYTHNNDINNRVLSELETFFDQTAEVLDNPTPEGDEEENSTEQRTNSTITSKVYLTSSQINLLKSLSKEEREEFEKALTDIVTASLEQGIREDSRDTALLAIKDELYRIPFGEKFPDLGYSIISSIIEPNLVVDYAATAKAREEKAAEVKPVKVLKNQKIVDEGDIVTEEIYSLLNSLGYIQTNTIKSNIVPIIGLFCFVVIIFSLFVKYMYSHQKSIYRSKKKVLLIFTLYILVIVLTTLLKGFHFAYMPVLFFTMLIANLLNKRLSLFLNAVVSIMTMLIYDGNIDFLAYFLASGTLISLTAGYNDERNSIVYIGIFDSIGFAIIMGCTTIFFNLSWRTEVLNNMLYAFLSGILTLILVVGSLPIWEAVFGIVSNVKLLELINPDKKLLKRLMLEAPATYHHSLIVSNLAEAAAMSIGADPVLAKVGGYYHDIGKLKCPSNFSENITGDSIHNHLKPLESIALIKSHVDDGLILAAEEKLPPIIVDFIREHHGTTLIKYFYGKAQEENPDATIDQQPFRYSNPIPHSKEVAIVMLADTAEAAVRSMYSKKASLEDVEEFVTRLIKDKLNDNQLLESNLRIKDLTLIKDAFMDIFKGLYHERIAYPTTEENKDEEKVIE